MFFQSITLASNHGIACLDQHDAQQRRTLNEATMYFTSIRCRNRHADVAQMCYVIYQHTPQVKTERGLRGFDPLTGSGSWYAQYRKDRVGIRKPFGRNKAAAVAYLDKARTLKRTGEGRIEIQATDREDYGCSTQLRKPDQ